MSVVCAGGLKSAERVEITEEKINLREGESR